MATVLERYIAEHPNSAARHAEARRLFPDGVTHASRRSSVFPLYVTHAQGSRKWDVDGHEIIDYVMGHGALLLGHAHPAIVAAVQDQIVKGTHYGASQDLELKWGALVQQLVPSAERVRFVNSGTEADMLAVRIARAYTGKNKIIKFEGHFHGWSDGFQSSVMTSAGPMHPAGIPANVLSNVIVLPPNDIARVESVLRQDADVAAVILEPTGASMGKFPVYPQFLKELREVTQRYGVILIFDEVVTGFRLSPGGAQARFGVVPDLTALAKILAGGLPGGAVAGRADLLHLLEAEDDSGPRIGHPGTFNANPLSAASGTACLSLIATGEENRKADEAGRRLREGMNEVLARHHIPGCVTGTSSILHLRLGQPCSEQCGDREWCVRPWMSSQHVQDMTKLALNNAGLDALGATWLVSSAHSPQDVEETLARFEEAVLALRRDEIV